MTCLLRACPLFLGWPLFTGITVFQIRTGKFGKTYVLENRSQPMNEEWKKDNNIEHTINERVLEKTSMLIFCVKLENKKK